MKEIHKEHDETDEFNREKKRFVIGPGGLFPTLNLKLFWYWISLK